MLRGSKYTNVLFPFMLLCIFYNKYILIEAEKDSIEIIEGTDLFFKFGFNECI